MKRKSALKKQHKQKRLEWCSSHMQWRDEGNNVLFTAEKKFNLDGPDELNYYWHDVQKGYRQFSKRVQGGGSIMIWVGIGMNFKTKIIIIKWKMNAEKYQMLLNDNLILPSNNILGRNLLLEQDNASIHIAKSTKKFIEENHIQCIDWPALSPDLNIIENILEINVREVYKDEEKYQSISGLKKKVLNGHGKKLDKI